MKKIKIKEELTYNVQSQCSACLSTGRTLLPIGKYLNLYKKFILDYIFTIETSTENIKLCWECHSTLRKLSQFQRQVVKANEIIRNGQSYSYSTLSSLTTVVLNDNNLHVIYLNDGISGTNIESDDETFKNCYGDTSIRQKYSDISEKNNDNSFAEETFDNDDGFDVKCDDGDIKNEISTKIDKDETTKAENDKIIKKVSKWAKKRAIQNKKPKFKIVTQNNLVTNDIFRRVQIDVKQLEQCMARERDSDMYKDSEYKCESCIKVFKTKNQLVKHNILWHSRDAGAYKCDICDSRLPRSKLTRHIQTHYRRYECGVCNLWCYKRDRRRHLLEKHAKIFQCLKCDLKFSCRQDFFNHFKDSHERFTCDHCGVSFKMRYCIKDHLKKQHSPFECISCDKRFARYNGLWLHNKLRHAPPAPPAYCVECDKQYPDVYRYRWHLANSARHKPKAKVKVPCPECDKVFSKKIYMRNHHDLVHLRQYRHRCEQCDKNFIRNADLVKHNRRVHEGVLPPKNKICYVCGRGFTTNKILTNHLRTHTGERPHACNSCPAAFAQRAALRGHQRALRHH